MLILLLMICPKYELFFKNLSSESRIKILDALREKSMNVSEICAKIGEEQSKVSHNLKHLADCNFLEVTQVGKTRVYSLNKDTIVPILDLVDKHVKKHCSTCSKR